MNPTREPERSEAQRIVRDTIGANQPRVVIAHSLGSVVTWETLWANPDLEPIDLLITIGSPLALPHVVYQKLDSRPDSRRKAARPPQVRHWANLSDPGDLIAILRPLSTYFDVDVELEPVIGAFNFHNVDRYLGNAAIAGIISTTLVTPRTV